MTLANTFQSRISEVYRIYLSANIGLLFIVLSQFFNSIMVTTTKLLVTDEDPIHPLQILFVRMLITAIGCVLYLKYYKQEAQLWGPKELRWLLVLRGAMGFIGVFAMYYSLMYLSVSEATVITFLVPSMTGFLAWVLLRERWSLIEALGSVVSLIGVMLIARPSFLFGTGNDGANGAAAERLTATMVALIGVCGASMVYIVIRFIGKRVHSLVMVNFFATTTLIVSFLGLILIPHLGFKIPKNGKQWLLFFALGISGFFMQFLLTEGIQREKASRASMMLYSQMIYSVMWEITIWHKLPGFWSWCGIVIILGAAFVVIKNKPKEPVKLSTEGEQAEETEFDISMDDDVISSEVDITVDNTPAQSPK